MKDMILEFIGLVARKEYESAIKNYEDIKISNVQILKENGKYSHENSKLIKEKDELASQCKSLKLELEILGRQFIELEKRYDRFRDDISSLRKLRNELDRMIEFHFTRDEANRKFEGTKVSNKIALKDVVF